MVFSTRALALSATGLIAIAVGTIGFARAHPSLAENPPAVYGLDPAAAPEDPAANLSTQQHRNVSVNFSNAPVSRVLEWLAKQDANFVVSSASVPADLKISLNVKGQPLAPVEHAIAAAMGGTWSNRDGILVFRKRAGLESPFATSPWGDNPLSGNDLKQLKNLKDLPGGMQIWSGPDGKQFELQLKGLTDQFGPDFQKKMQDQFGPEFQKKMQDDFGPTFQKKLLDKIGKNGPNGFIFQAPIGEEQHNLFSLHSQDLNGLMNSLTDDQKATMKRKGYLSPKDLNEKQLKMLGEMKGKFEVKVQSDKGSMTIKSG